MKILYAISTLGGGGAESYLCSYAIELKKQSQDVDFEICAIKSGGVFEKKLSENGIKYTIIHQKGIFGAAKSIRKFIKEEKFDIIHSHMFFSDIVSRLATVGLRVKTVATHHGLGKWKKKSFILLDKITKHLVDRFIMVSKQSYELRISREKYPIKKTRVIHNGISRDFLSATSKKLPVNEQKITIGTIARMTDNKQINLMVDVMKDLESYPNLQYEIIGEGENYEKLVNQVKVLKLEDRVNFVGWQNNVLPFLEKWHIFALPSVNEDLPVSMIECMAQGIVPIASTVGGIVTLLDGGKNGVLCNSAKRKTFADAIEFLILNPQKYNEMSENCRRYIEKFFLIEENVYQTLEVYKELLG